MPIGPSTVHSLRRVFQQAFVVHDLAEPLVSFDFEASADEVKEFMQANRLEIVGVRKEGHVAGFVEIDDLGDGSCSAYLKPFDEATIVLDTLPLHELIPSFHDRRRLFVSVLGRVGGIISRTDLQKPPARMWLFGMVTLIEMQLGQLIRRFCPDDEWKAFLSEGRVQKANELLRERSRRNQELVLLDCLQLSDKAQIVARNPELRAKTRFESRKQMEKTAKSIEKLRNNLVHAQDIITNDWEVIVTLSENIDPVLAGPPGLRAGD